MGAIAGLAQVQAGNLALAQQYQAGNIQMAQVQQNDDSKRRRRLAAGQYTDNMCDAIANMIKLETKGDLVNLVSSNGKDQHEVIKMERMKIISKCSEMNLVGSDQCRLYVTLLDVTDPDDSVSKAAWMDSMGSEADHSRMCNLVVRHVNRNIDAIAADPNVPIEVVDGKIVLTGRELANHQHEKFGYRSIEDRFLPGGYPHRSIEDRFLPGGYPHRSVEEEGAASCKVATGVAGTIVAGASMVGVVLGTMCKTWNEQAAPLLTQSV